jgi:hypothetical protein
MRGSSGHIGRRGLLLVPALALGSSRDARAQRGGSAGPSSPPLVVVVGASSSLTNIDLARLRGLYLGDGMTEGTGRRIVPFHQRPLSPDRVGFERVVLGMSPDESAAYWIDRRIRGEGKAPRAVDDVALLRRLVASFPGALAYVRAQSSEPTLRMLRVDGKLPGERGYPLVGI